MREEELKREREIARDDKIAFIMFAISEVEGVETSFEDYDDKTDEELEEMADWYDHLLEK